MVRKGEIRRGSANQNTLFLYYSLYFSSKYSIQMNSSEPVSKFNFIHFLLNCPSCTLYIFFMTQEFLYWTSYEIILSFGWKFLILSGFFFFGRTFIYLVSNCTVLAGLPYVAFGRWLRFCFLILTSYLQVLMSRRAFRMTLVWQVFLAFSLLIDYYEFSIFLEFCLQWRCW